MSAGERNRDQRSPSVGDLDPRLVEPAGRMKLAVIALDHETSRSTGRCRECGWATGGGQQGCPSRVLARCVADQRPVPGWLAHLVAVVPGAISPPARLSETERAVFEDGLPGLFDAPARVDPTATTTTTARTGS